MKCPDCNTDGIYMLMENFKQQYYCPKCKIIYSVKVDPESIEFEDVEYDDSECDYGG